MRWNDFFDSNMFRILKASLTQASARRIGRAASICAQKLAATALTITLACQALAEEAPTRVVSINLCTDQLALELAAPGQLVSVTRYAADPRTSVHHDRLGDMHLNTARAEEVYLLDPDLVLAGTFSDPVTVSMLERLGIPVIRFAPASALADIPALLEQMGAALGQQARAAAIIADFQTRLDALSAPPEKRPRAALTYVNSYSSGPKTMAGDILRAAGFDNVAGEIGLERSGVIGLEALVFLDPQVIIRGRDYAGTSRSEDNLNHPALRRLTGTVHTEINARDWICGTPQALHAVQAMVDLRGGIDAR